MKIELFEDAGWEMSLGERAALEGVLAQLRPAVAIAAGAVAAACLGRLAAHAREVHAFGQQPSGPPAENVTAHGGDPYELLPALLAELARHEQGVDFVLIDGEHTPAGVRRYIECLLDSPAVADTVILVHDSANEHVRSGFDAVHFRAWPKVARVEPDWIPGQLFADPARHNQLWYGLALVLVDVARPAYMNGEVFEQRYHPAGHLLAEMRQLVQARERGSAPAPDSPLEVEALHDRIASLERELATAYERGAHTVELKDQLDIANKIIEDLKDSVSWRVTSPLRAAKRYRQLGGDSGRP